MLVYRQVPASILERAHPRHDRSSSGAWRCAARHDLLSRSRKLQPQADANAISAKYQRPRLFCSRLQHCLLRGFSTAPASAGYPDRIDQDRRALCAGRRHRRGRAHAGAGDGEGSRRLHHYRKQAGGGDHHRHPGRRGQRAGRLHAADGDVRERGQSQPEREAALRSAQGFRARGAGRALLQYRRGQSQIADQVDRRPDRGGESRP